MRQFWAVQTFVRAILGGLLAWLAIASPAIALSGSISSFDNFADEAVRALMRRHGIPGAAVAIVADGEIVAAEGYGWGDRAQSMKVNAESTLFRVDGVSQVLTAIAALQQVERGALEIESDINTYLDRSALRAPDAISQTTADKPLVLGHLLSHTDGFDPGWSVGTLVRSPDDPISLARFLQERLRPRLLPPDEMFLDSEVGITLAGHLVEIATEQPFAEYVEQQIFLPLGMTHSSFTQPIPDYVRPNLARGYELKGGQFHPRPSASVNSFPATGLVTSATDMARLALALLQEGCFGGACILPADEVAQMQRRQFAPHPQLPGATYGFFERFVNGRRAIAQHGRADGFRSLLLLVPDENIGFFIACNRNADRFIADFTQSFFDRYFPARHGAPPTPTPTTDPRDLAGTYRLSSYSHLTLEKLAVALGRVPEVEAIVNRDGSLIVGDRRWVEIEPLLFRATESETLLTFRRDDRGRVQYLFIGDSVFGTMERLAWYEPTRVRRAIARGCTIAFVAGIVFAGLRHRRRERWARWSAIALSITNLIFAAGATAIVAHSQPWTFAYGLPLSVRFLCGLPALSLICWGVAVGAIASSKLPTFARLGYGSIAGAGAIFLLVLAYWNLLPIGAI
ncbi:beta-lactamase class C and other penicillin binding protein [Rubidibacter lacunae KORDI 51-2]|uniref:Beta-lactamase class C and other penicillin binding protein n=1 Tax=Rubidibacter lacunae KORDI 51-2 TaxID=582515 RepID=U5DF74_9CHRO|nr:serine hydrolase domain-containing protein [Rubidibacter lacunae]ERN43143.1 beta-lactamase class C and other penicillin binding protein [Rubidibacter lacunae KORDI 51-2]